MESAEPRKTTLPGGETHGVMVCRRCGWPFPNAHPSPRYRRAHKRMCGTIEGYTVTVDSAVALSERSTVSSISDDERGSDGDSKTSSLVSRSVSGGSSGRVLERMNSSADDVFADAVSEFAGTNGSQAGDEGLEITTEILSHKTLGEDSAVTGIIEASVNSEDSMSKPAQEPNATSPAPENVTSFSEIPAKFETVTNAGEENEGASANEQMPMPVKIDDASTPSEPMTEGRTIIDNSVVKSETYPNEEKDDVKSGFEISGVDQSQGGETLIRSSDEIFDVKIDDIPQTKVRSMEDSEIHFPKISENSKVVPSNNNAVIVTCDALDSGSENEMEGRGGLSVVGIGTPPTNTGIETVETSSVHAVSGHVSEESSKKYQDNLARDSSSGVNGAILEKDESGQVAGNDMIDTEDGFENRGIIAQDFLPGKEVMESDVNVANLCLDIGSEHASSLPVVSVCDTHGTTEIVVCDDIGSGNAVQLSSDIDTDDGSIRNDEGISKDVKLECTEAAVPVIDPKPVRHSELLHKLEEDLSGEEPVETSVAAKSSSQGQVNNKVEDVRVLCEDASSKDFGQPQERHVDPEKSTTISTADLYEISSPNGSSLDGNWGSVSVLSSMSDATADVKKMKNAQEGQSHAKSEIFEPPSFLTLIEPETQKAAAATGSKTTEVQNPQQHSAAKAAWFPSITNVANDSHGRQKNEEIIAKVTNWSAGKQHSPLKMLLSEAKSPAVPKDNNNSSANSGAQVTTVKSIIDSQEPELPKDTLESSMKEWPDEIKGEKRKAKSKPYWVPFMCCSSAK